MLEPSREISPASLASEREVAVVDVRPLQERFGDLGYLPGSRAFEADDAERLAAVLRAEYGDREVVCVCLSGRRSGEIVAELRQAGFANARNLAGGVLAWREAGLPTVGLDDPDDVPAVECPEDLLRAVLACFVAETVEVALDRGEFDVGDGGYDPRAEVEAHFAPALATDPPDKRRLHEALDQLAEVARFRGHPLDRIAVNVGRLRRAIEEL